jgi:hypothetical protein
MVDLVLHESSENWMLNVTEVLTAIVSDLASAHFREIYPRRSASAVDHVLRFAGTALDSIGKSDALYHNVEHTAHVTIVGLHVLRGKQQSEGAVTPEIWGNVVIALLSHDIGYVRGLCRFDTTTSLVTGTDGQPFDDIAGSSDAMLMPIHVNRGKRFVEEQFIDQLAVDIGFVNACIERTRFPVPDDPWYAQTDDYPGLVRAADLIGQLSDPRYLNKLSAIFYEFEEVGFNESMGYECPGDLLDGYPRFFDSSVRPYIAEAVTFLEKTTEGRDIVGHLYGNLAAAREAQAGSLPTAANS